MTGRLAGKVGLVTGAGRGIGRAIAVAFAAEGAKVGVADIDAEAADAVAREIVQGGGAALGIGCDIADAGQAEQAVTVTVDAFGTINVLVNNAATFIPDGTVESIDPADWRRSMAVNLDGAFLMSRYAVPVMRGAGGGSIVHMASQLGHVAKAGRSWYCVAKGGILQLARTMAMDHAADNIRVNSLSPGPVATERIFRRYGSERDANEMSGSLTLMNRLGQPAEIAHAAVFLASDESSFMTGSDLLVDGGYNAR